MSKLDRNRKTKMMLAKHKERFENRHEAKNPQLRPTEEELKKIRDYILFPFMMSLVQKSIVEIGNQSNLLKQLYLSAGRALMNQISDLFDLRRELRSRNIKIVSEEQVDVVMYHRFICRGYEERFGMVTDVIRSEISTRLTSYIKSLVDKLKTAARGV